MSHYPYQGQGGQNYGTYDQSAYLPQQHQHSQYQQQYDPNGYGNPGGGGGVSAPPYSAHPVASGMMAAGGGPSGPGNGYSPIPAFNSSYTNGGGGYQTGGGYENYNDNGISNGSGNGNYNNGTMAYGNVPVPAAGHNYQGGGLTYQQTLPSTQPGGTVGGGGTGADVRAQAPQPEGDYPVVMAIDFALD
ncbi:hypothetical protein BG015_006066 [Linnemannia schmuckeri]|uniref:Uncharacterized protein n=1 Tax=Linnemannia schmuckeri TaxID=64567 RepID=A0A9P5R4C6_9FUNG|nr:hypothetical protein BG015_006066 [Linnemannia schmuckeri]